MSRGKSPLSGSSKSMWLVRKPSGGEVWTYAHNPYDDSFQNNDTNTQRLLNPCRHYAEGCCNRGSACRFHHDARHNIIVTPHSTPKQRAITPLIGMPCFFGTNVAAGPMSPIKSLGTAQGRHSHASSAMDSFASTVPTETSTRQHSLGSLTESKSRLFGGASQYSCSKMGILPMDANNSDSPMVSPVYQGDVLLRTDFLPATSQQLSQQQ
ncbi:hypothetical protein BCY84_04076 [Trypanosoma cruzi cruzi]|uniref:C3H1-type domain-containing protein n=1 Tax=Trypanosoma cruzi TaxID=5693 RepID=A0A2V2UIV3_TRYCR|nr:hypothetical protein TcBrA4_0078770 [Trypanosoma cruzi]PBJ72207.1 hypothetical protein BCY84_15785 [Trypanosoma cruzi cruzi]PBJ78691.1 hypothetical protein BCY84_04076 [Trypanosoma cruzi cruzi]PWU84125.1 hypothetical protein C4B63_253g16 [Trypanosoma cruzi]